MDVDKYVNLTFEISVLICNKTFVGTFWAYVLKR